ncbi:hypothetical protein [Prosthecochloris vibrioformis]|uniref:Uncharacterized protein n=1 Tax=Prosthecochloris vibrioformis TaxID=1098 RepID=A0A5C4S2P2_PROVB|nr:hypothetical protein [Prosthecochloris vibrioformis]TNJ37402.1 hypothetical protein FGF68_04115 [Prosthecochloris vibrioformis]
MGEFDRPEWVPSEQYLKEVLCRARETDWEWSDYRANGALGIMADGTVRYRTGAPYGENGEVLEYNEYLWKRQNYPAIPETYMQPVKGWRGMSLSDILANIIKGRGSEADYYRNTLFEAIDSYRLAAKYMLIDTYRRIGDRYRYGSGEYVAMKDRRETIRRADSSGYEYMPESPVELYGIFPFLGARESDKFDECRGEIDCSTDEDLVKKIIAVERIKQLISERAGQDTPAKSDEEQAGEPVAGRELIGWRGTPEQLKRLAEELQQEKFIANAEAFAGQFDKAGRAEGGHCEWRGSITQLVYLFDVLKDVGLVRKNSTPDRLVESSFSGGDYSADGRPKTFENLRQARKNYKANNTTLSGELNTDEDGIPDKGGIIHQIVQRIANG